MRAPWRPPGCPDPRTPESTPVLTCWEPLGGPEAGQGHSRLCQTQGAPVLHRDPSWCSDRDPSGKMQAPGLRLAGRSRGRSRLRGAGQSQAPARVCELGLS